MRNSALEFLVFLVRGSGPLPGWTSHKETTKFIAWIYCFPEIHGARNLAGITCDPGTIAV